MTVLDRSGPYRATDRASMEETNSTIVSADAPSINYSFRLLFKCISRVQLSPVEEEDDIAVEMAVKESFRPSKLASIAFKVTIRSSTFVNLVVVVVVVSAVIGKVNFSMSSSVVSTVFPAAVISACTSEMAAVIRTWMTSFRNVFWVLSSVTSSVEKAMIFLVEKM